MRVFLEKTVVRRELSDVQCNACGQQVAKDSYGNLLDYVSLFKQWGYHSPFDGEAHAIDLCVACYSGWVAQFAIPPAVQTPDEELAACV